MKIEHKLIPVRDLVDGFVDAEEQGVAAFHGKLDVRPPYQREFIYKPEQQKAVIDTVKQHLPLNVMYWAKVTDLDEAGNEVIRYEVLDGQQRTLSICNYVAGKFSDDDEMFFNNLPADIAAAMLDYEVSVYICEGTDSEKLAWFKRINIAGEKLTDQELRNAVYAGPWLSQVKRYFSRVNGPAYQVGAAYLAGHANRQEYLATAIKWVAQAKGYSSIEGYMAKHQMDAVSDPEKTELVEHFLTVLDWVKMLFPVYRAQMDGLDWGGFWVKHHGKPYSARALEAEVSKLMADDEVKNKKGIYDYVLSGNINALNLRSFSKSEKATMYERQGHKCTEPHWSGHDRDEEFALEEMEGDHIVPWSQGGRTDLANGQMLCKKCNRVKSNK